MTSKELVKIFLKIESSGKKRARKASRTKRGSKSRIKFGLWEKKVLCERNILKRPEDMKFAGFT